MLENPFKTLDDEALHQALLVLAEREKETGADIILHLLLVKERKLYAALGHDSLFTYCTERLGFARSTAYRRKTVVDRVREFPALIERLRDGRLQLCAAAALAPHLTAGNAQELLDAVVNLSHREVESYLVKRLRPARATLKQPAPAPFGLCGTATMGEESRPLLPCPPWTGESSPRAADKATSAVTNAEAMAKAEAAVTAETLPKPRTIIKPLTADTCRVNVTFSDKTLAKLKRAKELLAGRTDDEVFSRALDRLLEQLAPERRQARRVQRLAKRAAKQSAQATEQPTQATEQSAQATEQSRRTTTPTTPARSKATPAPSSRRGRLADRDRAVGNLGNQCAFVGPDGRRCTARSFLEVDHIVPWSGGGPSELWNYQPLCRTHNAFKGAATPSFQALNCGQ